MSLFSVSIWVRMWVWGCCNLRPWGKPARGLGQLKGKEAKTWMTSFLSPPSNHSKSPSLSSNSLGMGVNKIPLCLRWCKSSFLFLETKEIPAYVKDQLTIFRKISANLAWASQSNQHSRGTAIVARCQRSRARWESSSQKRRWGGILNKIYYQWRYPFTGWVSLDTQPSVLWFFSFFKLVHRISALQILPDMPMRDELATRSEQVSYLADRFS